MAGEKKIRVVVVDDEPLARESVVMLLARDAGVEVVGEFGGGAEAVEGIRRLRPELVFLDVQMPEVDGFDVLEMLGGEMPRAVVFVTAYDQYAIKAFEAGALDYLLKPFDDARFERAVERAKERVAASGVSKSKVIAVKSAGSVVFLRQEEIDWIEAADYYSSLHVGTKTHLLRRSMAELEEELDEAMFVRIHRSTIVRMERVRGLRLNEGGEYDVLMECGTRLRLSRRYRRAVQERMGLVGE